jgi:hypothetical protein
VNLPVGYDPAVTQTWVLIRAGGGIAGFDAGQFTVNGAGTGTANVTTNAEGELLVAYAPATAVTLALTGIRHAGGTNEVTVSSSGATDVVLELTADLVQTNWQPVATQTVSGSAVLADPAVTNGAGYYRARVK